MGANQNSTGGTYHKTVLSPCTDYDSDARSVAVLVLAGLQKSRSGPVR